MPHRLIKSIDGRRGSVLAIMGAILSLVSVSMIVRPDPYWVPGWLSYQALGWLFFACSSVAFTVGVCSRLLPKRAIAHGFAAAFVPALGLAALFTLAAILGASPTAYLYAAVFAGYAALVYLISGWEEPRPFAPMTDEQRQIAEGD